MVMLQSGTSPLRIRKTAADRDAIPPPMRKTLVLVGSDLTLWTVEGLAWGMVGSPILGEGDRRRIEPHRA